MSSAESQSNLCDVIERRYVCIQNKSLPRYSTLVSIFVFIYRNNISSMHRHDHLYIHLIIIHIHLMFTIGHDWTVIQIK